MLSVSYDFQLLRVIFNPSMIKRRRQKNDIKAWEVGDRKNSCYNIDLGYCTFLMHYQS